MAFLPCPFCGSPDLRVEINRLSDSSVECNANGCHALIRIRPTSYGGKDTNGIMAMLEMAWNKRVGGVQ